MNNRTWRLSGAATIAALIASAAIAQTSPEPGPPTLSARAEAIVQAWRGTMDAHTALLSSLPPADSLAEELARRVALEQTARLSIGVVSRSKLTPLDAQSATSAIWRQLSAMDAENTAYVKSVLPSDGWFRRSRDGDEVASNAWLIIQHSPDKELQRQIMTAMEPLVKVGEADGGQYAMLYDRSEMREGRPQRYGSQGACKDGTLALHTLEDPTKVDEWRRAIGLSQSLAEYSAMLRVGKPC